MPSAELLAAKAAGIQDPAPAAEDTLLPRPAEDNDTAHAASNAYVRNEPARAAFPPALRDDDAHQHTDNAFGIGDEHHDQNHEGNEEEEEEEEEDEEEEIPWGPAHPCFPHLNPHVPSTSPLHASTRIIRVKRDWMVAGDLAPTFANLYPEVLDPLVSEDEFRRVVKHVNEVLVAAFDPWDGRSWVDAVMGVATGWLWDDVGLAAVKRRLAKLEAWIEGWNREVGFREGVQIVPLRRTGYLSLDFQIPDPHIGTVESNARPVVSAPPQAHLQDHNDGTAPQLHGEFGPFPTHRVPLESR